MEAMKQRITMYSSNEWGKRTLAQKGAFDCASKFSGANIAEKISTEEAFQSCFQPSVSHPLGPNRFVSILINPDVYRL